MKRLIKSFNFKKAKIQLFTVALALFSTIDSFGQSQTVSLIADGDAVIDQQLPTTVINNGAGNLVTNPNYYAVWSQFEREMSLISFDLSSIPAGSTISSAKITIQGLNTSAWNSRTIQLHKVTSPWSETTVTWNSFNGAYSATAIASDLVYNTKPFAEWTITSEIQSIIDGSSANNGWLFQDVTGDYWSDYFRYQYGSKEHTNSAKHPVLEITYTPPAGLNLSATSETICDGESTTLTASGGTTYSWSPSTGLSATSGESVTATPSVTTTYTVTSGSESEQITITVNTTPTVGLTAVKATGGCDGEISTAVSGGTSYTYAWTGPSGYTSSDQNITGLCAGMYNVAVTSNGCTTNESIEVIDCNSIGYTVEKTQPCFGSSNGEITLVGFSGNNGGGTSAACPGQLYECTDGIQDMTQTGHISVAPGEVRTNAAGSFNGDLTVNGGVFVVCGSVYVKDLVLTNGGTIYLANGSLTFSKNITVPDNCKIVQGTSLGGATNFMDGAEVYGTIFNLNGSMSFLGSTTNIHSTGAIYNSSTMNLNGSPYASNYTQAELDDCINNGGNQQQQNYTDLNTCSISWTGTDGNGDPITGLGTGSVISGLAEGTYTASISCGGCDATEVVVLSDPAAALTITVDNITNTNEIPCNGGANVTITGGVAPYTYEWRSVADQSGVSGYEDLAGVCAGDYELTVEDATECTASTTVTVGQDLLACCGSLTSVNVTQPSCAGGNGSLELVVSSACDGGNNGTGVVLDPGCIDEAIVANYTCWDDHSKFTRIINSGNDEVIAAGEIVLLNNYTDYGNITLDGGVLVVCPALNFQNFTFNSGELYSLTSVRMVNLLNGTGGAGERKIWAHGSVLVDAGDYEGDVQNYNAIRFSDSYINASYAESYSQGDFHVYGNYTNDGYFRNRSSSIETNSFRVFGNGTNNGMIDNYCRFIVDGIYTENGTRSDTDPAMVSTGSGGSSGNNGPTCTVVWKDDQGQVIVPANDPNFLEGLSGGTYTAEITCDNGCDKTETFVLTDPTGVSVSLSLVTKTTAAAPACDGTAEVVAVNGSGNYTYSWIEVNSGSEVSTAATAANLCAGDYTVTVTDNTNNCSASLTVTIISSTGGNCGITVDETVANTICPSKATGAITVNSVTGGVTPYTYRWSTGAITQNIQDLPVGEYKLTVTGDDQCFQIFTYNVVADNADCGTDCDNGPQAGISASKLTNCGTAPSCDGFVAFTTSGGTGTVNSYWKGGITNDLSFNGLCQGTYAFMVKDANDCYAAVNVEAEDCDVNNPCLGVKLDAEATVVKTDCPEKATGSITITQGLGGVAPYTYKWSTGETTAAIEKLGEGDYTVTITDANNCKNDVVFHVGSTNTNCGTSCDNKPAVTISTHNFETCTPACDGAVSFNVTAGNGNEVMYWKGIEVSSESFSSLCEDNYHFKVIDKNNCYAESYIVISDCNGNNNNNSPTFCENKGITAEINNIVDASCDVVADGVIEIGIATNGVIGGDGPYIFEMNGAVVTNQTANPVFTKTNAVPGMNYNFKIKDKDGCVVEKSVAISAGNCNGTECNYSMDLDINKTKVTCENKCDGKVLVNVTTNPTQTENFDYYWDDVYSATPAKDGLCDGIHKFTVVNQTDGCVKNEFIPIGVNQDASIGCTDVTVSINNVSDGACSGAGSATLTVNSGVAPFTVYVDDVLYTSTSSSTIEITSLLPGDRVIKVVDANGNVQQDEITISDLGGAPFGITVLNIDDQACVGGNLGAISVAVTGGVAPVTQVWDDASASTGVTVSNLVNGTYTITATDANGCEISKSIPVGGGTGNVDASIASFPTSAVDVCDGAAAVLANGNNTPFTYAWNTGGTNSSKGSLCTGYNTVTVTDAGGCTKDFWVFIGVSNDCSYDLTSDVNSESCNGNDGYVHLDLQNESQVSAACYDGPRESTSTCEACDVYLSGSAGHSSTDNRKYCVKSGDVFTGALTMTAGELVVCGELNSSSVSLSNTAKLVNNGKVTAANFSASAADVLISNYGVMNLPHIGVSANFENYGLMNITGAPSTYQYGYTFTNRGEVVFTQSLTASGTIINEGVLKGTIGSVQGGIMFTNKCTADFSGDFTVLGNVTNEGKFNVGGLFSLYGGTALTNKDGALFETQSFANSTGTITGGTTLASTFRVFGTKSGTGAYNGKLNVCNISTQDGTFGPDVNIVNCNDNISTCQVTWTGNGVTGSHDLNINNLSAGTYTASINCGSGCQEDVDFVVNPFSPIQITSNSSGALCSGGDNGEINITVSGGNAPYTYAWTGPGVDATAKDQTGLSAGAYSVTVTDASGCVSAAKNFTIESQTPIAIQTFSNPTCSGKDFGSVWAVVNGGTGAGSFGYVWKDDLNNPIAYTSEAFNLYSGDYTVEVKDQNGCTESQTVNVAVDGSLTCNDNARDFKVESFGTPISCVGKEDGVGYVTVTGGSGNYSINWNGLDPQALAPGTYTVSVTDIDYNFVRNTTFEVENTTNNNCFRECELSINFSTIADIECIGTDNGEIYLEVNGATNPVVNVYEVGVVTPLHSGILAGTDPTLTLSNLRQGKFIVEVIDGACSKSAETFVYAPRLLEIYGSAREMCPGETIELASSYNTGNNWTKDGSFFSDEANIVITEKGLYELTLTGDACPTPQGDEVTIEAKENCDPKHPQCLEIEMPVQTLDIQDRCIQRQLIAARVHAEHEYKEYIESVTADFRSQYITKCLSSKEKFEMSYPDKEHHYTLYYYDQANNLVKTVPPQGVVLINEANYGTDEAAARLQRVKEDRKNGVQTVFTDHTYATDYEYNSLNQLIGQKLPDHDAMKIFESDDVSYAGIQPGLTINNVELDEAGNGFLMAQNAAGEGLIYETSDGGKNWTLKTTIGTKTLRDVMILDANTAFAVGDDGLFCKSVNAGNDWLAIPVGTVDDIVGVDFYTTQNGWLITDKGEVYYSADGGQNWDGFTGIGISNLEVIDVSFDDAGTTAYALATKGGISYVYETTDQGANWTEMLDQQIKVNGVNNMTSTKDGAIYLYGNNGVVVKSSDNGVTWDWLSNDVEGEVKAAYFRSDNKGVIGTATKLNRTYNDGVTIDETLAGTASIATQDISVNAADNVGMIISSDNKVYATINGGMSVTNVTSNLASLLSTNNSNLIAVATSKETAGVAITADDKGNFYDYYAGVWTQNVNALGVGEVVAGQLQLIGDKIHLINNTGAYVNRANGAAFVEPATIGGISNTNFVGLAEDNGDLYLMNISGQLFKSTDAGVTWSIATTNLSSISTTISEFNISEQGIYIATNNDGVIAQSTDGLTWNDYSANVSVTGATSIHFSGTNILLGGANGLVATATIGSPWEAIGAGENGKPDVTDVRYISSSNITIATNGNGVMKTTNEGNSWSTLSLDASTSNPTSGTSFNAINKSSEATIAVGDGASCTAGTTTIVEDFYDVAYFHNGGNPITLAVGAHGDIVKKTGSSWSCVTMVDALVLYDTEMIGNTGVGYGVGKDGTVVKTENSGQDWDNLNSGQEWDTQNNNQVNDLHAVAFTSISEGVAVGENGTIVRTATGGDDHFQATVTTPGTAATLNDVEWADAKTAFAVGNGGTIWRTTNKGASWSIVNTLDENGLTLSIGNDLKAVSFADQRVGYVAGTLGKVYRYEEGYAGGEVWKEVAISTTTATVNDIYFIDYERGYAVCDGGEVYKTVNGGDTWTSQTDIYSGGADLTFIEPIGKNKFFIGGTNSTVTRTIDQADLYSVKFWYDELGRIIAKQDARQFPQNKFSYTVYDEYNRIVESGEVINNAESITEYAKLNVPSQVAYNDYITNWLNSANAQKQEVSVTKYDAPVINWASTAYTGTFEQTNLRPRVASTFYIEGPFNGTTTDIIAGTATIDYDFASHYSYDEHGNVETLLSENKHLEHIGQSYKRLDYTYDLISGNVNEVAYQAGEKDEFYHTYEYDEDNRIVNVMTSHDHVVWENDAHYDYYRHSVLKRTELGDDKVQGNDYAYTIHGWLKGVNSETLKPTRDLGKDGMAVAANELELAAAKDVVGFGLKYYSGDYSAVGNLTNDHFAADETALYAELTAKHTKSGRADNEGLYNGNISAMVTAIDNFMQGSQPSPQAMIYSYDQLNRIKSTDAYKNDAIGTSNSWAGIQSKTDYATTYDYDANGNIMKLTREGAGKGLMDDFEYVYENVANGYLRNTNRLAQVIDHQSDDTRYKEDIDSQGADNYIYDGIGNLTQDKAEEIDEIVWHVNGKVKEVKRTSGSTKDDLEFWYDAMGNRTVKIAKPRTAAGVTDETAWKYTYYNRDASGNVMAIYKRTYETTGANLYKEKVDVTEFDLYGSSRVGQYSPKDPSIAERTFTASVVGGELRYQTDITNQVFTNTNESEYNKTYKTYELSNHLGNVLAVVSDRVIPQSSDAITTESFEAEVVSASDYYPFGMQMIDRTDNSGDYRYGFQGQEIDSETGLVNYTFRMHNTRLGRFFAVDPLANDYSHNSPFAFSENRVIDATELEGLELNLVVQTWDASGMVQSVRIINYTDASGTKQDMNLLSAASGTQYGGTNTLVININPPAGTPSEQTLPSLTTAGRNYAVLDGNMNRMTSNPAGADGMSVRRSINMNIGGIVLTGTGPDGTVEGTPGRTTGVTTDRTTARVTRNEYTLNRRNSVSPAFADAQAVMPTDAATAQQIQDVSDFLNIYTNLGLTVTGNSPNSSSNASPVTSTPAGQPGPGMIDENNVYQAGATLGQLKQARANSVSNAIQGNGVAAGRITSNPSPAGPGGALNATTQYTGTP